MKDARSKVVTVLDGLIDMGFEGHTIADIAAHTGISYQAVRRSLNALQESGWVVPGEQSSTKEKRWIPGIKLVSVAHAHREYMLNEVLRLKKDYRDIAKEELC
ncbi:MAG: MarR family transcriptional regulator [Pseudomonadales bacterium]